MSADPLLAIIWLIIAFLIGRAWGRQNPKR